MCNPKKENRQKIICTILPHSAKAFDSTSTDFLLIADDLLFWDKKDLKIYFLNGPLDFQKYIIKIANKWSQYSGITFTSVNDNRLSDIRITFEEGGFSSALGTEATLYEITEPTMWLHDLFLYDSVTIHNTILHEFGHALGAMHELQSRNANIPWDKPAVYAYYKREYNWGIDSVDRWVFQKINYGKASYFDSLSVMAYAVPDSLTVGHYEIAWNDKLSDADKYYMKKWYDEKK